MPIPRRYAVAALSPTRIRLADRALYAAKRDGRDRVQVFVTEVIEPAAE